MRNLGRLYLQDREVEELSFNLLPFPIELKAELSHKVKNVLRASVKDKLDILTDSFILSCEVVLIGKKSVHIMVQEAKKKEKLNYTFKAYQCIAKREYMDLIIEKYTELGVTDIYPVISEHSFQLDKKGITKENTLERYKRLAIETSLQCERLHIPTIHEPIKLDSIDFSNVTTTFLFHERIGEFGLPEEKSDNISFIIGPEGGFSEKEVNRLKEKGIRAYTPINTILKAETAAIIFSGILSINNLVK